MATDSSTTTAILEDAGLLDRIRRGDRSAFDALFDRYFPRVYTWVSRNVPDQSSREQLVACILARALAIQAGDSAQRGAFARLVFALTLNEIAAERRRRRAG